ncbi:phosphotransferase enzyme family protein [Chloroflexota bacterium]
MMRLKYLYDNRNLAEMVLKNWDYDQSKLGLLDYYRISANAVYPFELNNVRYFLRFSPTEERSTEIIQAELEFLRYLRTEGYPAVDTLLSRTGKELENVETPWGNYLAVVFKGVPGNSLNRLELTGTLITGYGQALGELHKLSRKYLPSQYKRISWREQLDWMDNVLAGYTDETAAKTEVQILRSFLAGLPVTAENYGLVHYDFETDNVFYNETDKRYHVIDFDDAIYHWFALDIDQSIDSLIDDMPPDRQIEAKKLFIQGYRSIIPIEESMLAIMPVFRRYVNLYGYIRILRSSKDQWENEPDWMVDLRKKLFTAMEKRRIEFGILIS